MRIGIVTEQDLLKALVKDGRFDVGNPKGAFWGEICVARKDQR